MRRPRPSDAATRAQTRALAERVDEVVAGLLLEVTPAHPPQGAPAILVLMGFPGVGKSHVARLLAERLRAAHVASDHIRRQLFIAPSYGQEENAMLFGVIDGLIDRLVDSRYRVIVDATHLRHDTRRSVAALALRREVPIAYLLVTSSEEDTLGRLARRTRQRAADDHSDADERIYGAMRARGFEEPDVPYLTLVNGPDLAGDLERIGASVEERWSAGM